ncbi:MAG: 4Fe-4S dicluster domain-containing protein [Solitalea-like symbiont of Tyrophagus putrescentiae]
MAIIITDECINCGACEPECPNNAIYEGGAKWNFAQGTNLKGNIDISKLIDKNSQPNNIDADTENKPIENNIYYIVSNKCTECKGFHDEPQCAAVCPVDCCIPDDRFVESDEELLEKKDWLHNKV